MTRKRRRLVLVLVALALLGGATALVLSAFQDSLVFFYSPSEMLAKHVPPERRVRIGGLVETGSLGKETDGVTLHFTVTDTAHSIRVVYAGILPDLFREGQGVVAEGRLGSDGTFHADSVLAKHDEKYMPPEVAEAIKKSGHWEGKP